MEINQLSKLLSLSLVFTLMMNIFIAFFLVSYVAVHDYALVGLVEVGEDLVVDGMMSNVFVTAMDGLITTLSLFPALVDNIFLFSFIVFTSSLFYSAYRTPREGYFSVLGMVTIGVLIILFMLSIWLQFSEWIYDLIMGVIPNLTVSLPFFTWYMSNAGLINMIVIFICIILNFIDLDLSRFETRKDKEVKNDEI